METIDDAGNPVVTPVTEQQIPGGPFASQEAIKELGTNGGGPLNANSMHPFENPTRLSNLLEIYALLVIGFAFPITYGVMVGSKRQGRVVLAVMVGLWLTSAVLAGFFEQNGNPELTRTGRGPVARGRPGRRQRRGQGGPLRARRVGAVRGVDHRHLDRCRQCRP